MPTWRIQDLLSFRLRRMFPLWLETLAHSNEIVFKSLSSSDIVDGMLAMLGVKWRELLLVLAVEWTELGAELYPSSPKVDVDFLRGW